MSIAMKKIGYLFSGFVCIVLSVLCAVMFVLIVMTNLYLSEWLLALYMAVKYGALTLVWFHVGKWSIYRSVKVKEI